jgi:hypothetical protein
LNKPLSGAKSSLDLGCEVNSDISVIRQEHTIKYSLSGEYLSSNSVYSDYSAVAVLRPIRQRELQVKILAQATQKYAPRMKNILGGKTTTNKKMLLVPEIQFRLF